MKSNRVAVLMLIMLGFVQILKIGAIPCPAKCAIQCLNSPLTYPYCYVTCLALCGSLPKCAKSCGINKSITIYIDAAGKVTNVVDSCLHKCLK
ncbi:hypothetical protein DEO72_LG3g2691 [Vigna unguiculata]|uniref:Thionin-like protein 2 n=1 Tax=Vigna unguiculata TaxID=3917 RepID=A0A4D6LHN5_VIGUN|nr:hypothetical protein DEO72_LG3g2691 [Vigna unguiculata]